LYNISPNTTKTNATTPPIISPNVNLLKPSSLSDPESEFLFLFFTISSSTIPSALFAYIDASVSYFLKNNCLLSATTISTNSDTILN